MTDIPLYLPLVTLYRPLIDPGGAELVHRGSARVMTWRRAGLAWLVAGAVVAPGAAADESPAPNPEPLWHAYPLNQTPAGGGAAAPRPRASRLRPSPPKIDAPESGRFPIPLTAAGAAAVLLLAVALRRVGSCRRPGRAVAPIMTSASAA